MMHEEEELTIIADAEKLLSRVIEHFESSPWSWIQFRGRAHYRNPKTGGEGVSYCLGAALGFLGVGMNPHSQDAAVGAVCRQLNSAIPAWNDNPRRTREDVIRAVKNALTELMTRRRELTFRGSSADPS